MRSNKRRLAAVALAVLLAVLLPAVAAGATASSSAAVVPLPGVEAGRDAPSSDLDVLLAWLDDAPLVGLGENPHGVHEYHRLAHRLFAHSHARGAPHEPFGLWALEIDQAHAARLDDYVQGRRDDLEALLTERWYGSKIFYDAALDDLLRWMREHNRTAERPVHVARLRPEATRPPPMPAPIFAVGVPNAAASTPGRRSGRPGGEGPRIRGWG